jgi:ketosteroid isomerase-like protein
MGRNAEFVRTVFEALNERDLDRALSYSSPDFVMDWSNSIGPAKGVYRGKDEIRRLWGAFFDSFESMQWEPQEVIEVDESRVVVVNLTRMRGRGSGVDVEGRGAQLWVIEDGVGQSVKLLQSKADAHEAVGVTPEG